MRVEKSQVPLFVHQIFTTNSYLPLFPLFLASSSFNPISVFTVSPIFDFFCSRREHFLVNSFIMQRTNKQTMFYFMTDRKRLLGTLLFGAWNPARRDDVSRKQPRQWLKCFFQFLLLPLNATPEVCSARRSRWFGADSNWWNSNRLLSLSLRSVHANNG